MIKLIDYNIKKEGEEIFISKDNIGDMKRRNDATWIYTKNYEPAMYIVKETPEEILAMPDIEATEKVIDWEQRRYEIARKVLSYAAETSRSILMSGHSLGDDAKGKTFAEVCASSAISFADALIDVLKKGQDNEN